MDKLLLFAASAGEAHLILLIIFIFVMLFWLFGGLYWSRGAEGSWNWGGLGGTLIPWVAVAILGYLMFG